MLQQITYQHNSSDTTQLIVSTNSQQPQRNIKHYKSYSIYFYDKENVNIT